MVSKRRLAEVVLNRLNGGIINRDSKITIRQAEEAVGESRDYLIVKRMYDKYKAWGAFDVDFELLKEYTATTYKKGKKWVVDLPARVIPIVYGLGIYHVSLACCEEQDFIPKANGSTALYSGLGASNMEGQRSYFPREDFLELDGADGEVEIFMRLIPASISLSSREDFRITPDMEQDIVDMATQRLMMQIQFPQDVILNNVTDQS